MFLGMDRPLFDSEEEERDDSENEEEESSEAAFDAYQEAQAGVKKMWPKPASEHPDWKWTMMVDSYKIYLKLRRDQTFVNPDNFDMHVYNDFHAYGIHSCLEELVRSAHV